MSGWTLDASLPALRRGPATATGCPMMLYSAPLSLFARKVEIALAEKGLAFERVMVPFSQTAGYSPKHPDVLAANPKGQVPVLVDDGLSLFDSTVILEYLEDRYPTPPLYPGTPEGRARCRLDELLADEILLIPVRALMFRTEPPGAGPARRAEQEAGAAGPKPRSRGSMRISTCGWRAGSICTTPSRPPTSPCS